MAAKSDKPKRQRYTSPKGEALFCHVVEVDHGTEQYPDPKGSFNITLALDADAASRLDDMLAGEVDTARAYAEEKFEALKPASKKKLGEVKFNEPGPEEYDKEGNPTGRRLFRFKTAAYYEKQDGSRQRRRVPLFDAMMQPVSLSEEPGYGSVIRVSFICTPYFVDGQGMGGLSLYLDAVQIIKLKRRGELDAAAYGFSEEEGGFSGAAEAAVPAPTSSDNADDIPF